MQGTEFFSDAEGFFYETPIVEIVDLWFHRKTGKYAVCSLIGNDAAEEILWMSQRQFHCFRQQCRLRRDEGIYAGFQGGAFHHTFFGPPISEADYRLVRWFDSATNTLNWPVPYPLEVPQQVEIDESLRDNE